jgi:hypothetical protein
VENIILELGACIERKQITLDAAALHVGVAPTDLDAWLRGEAVPPAFFLGILPDAIRDISLLYRDPADTR